MNPDECVMEGIRRLILSKVNLIVDLDDDDDDCYVDLNDLVIDVVVAVVVNFFSRLLRGCFG